MLAWMPILITITASPAADSRGTAAARTVRRPDMHQSPKYPGPNDAGSRRTRNIMHSSQRVSFGSAIPSLHSGLAVLLRSQGHQSILQVLPAALFLGLTLLRLFYSGLGPSSSM